MGTGTYGASDGHVYDFTFIFTDTSGSLSVTGTISKRGPGQSGTLAAQGAVSPMLSIPVFESCLTKTQRTFLVTAEATTLLT